MSRQLFAARDLAQIAVFAALIAAMGLTPAIQVGSGGVPITLQTLGVMLAGAILGPWKGLASVGVFQILVAANLPLLSGGRGGVSYFYATASAGYLWGWLPGALVIGWLCRTALPAFKLYLTGLYTIIGGVLVIHLAGIIGMMIIGKMALWAAIVADAAFLPGDIAKAVLTVLVAEKVHRSYPGLMDMGRRRSTQAKKPVHAGA